MQFKANSTAFHTALKLVGLNKYSVAPLMIEADASGVTLTADSYPQFRQMTIPADVVAGGTILGDCRSIVNRFPKKGGDINISSDEAATDGRISAKIGGVSFRLPFGPIEQEERPILEPRTFEPVGTIPAKTLLNLMANVNYARSKDETRYNLCGISLQPCGDGIRAVATDGHRLAISAVDGVHLSRSIFISADMLAFISKAVPKDETGSWLYFSPSPTKPDKEGHPRKVGLDLMKVVCGPVTAIDSVEGEFPNVDMVIPTGMPIHVQADRGAVTEILAAIAALGTKRYRTGAILDVSTGRVVITAGTNTWEAEVSGEVPVTGTVPEPMKTMAAAQFLIDGLSKTGVSPLLEIRGKNDPIKISGTVDGYNNMAVIMPMRFD